MTHHLHDVARTLSQERLATPAGHRIEPVPHPGHDRSRLRSALGSALIRAGTRLQERTPERPRRVQASPHC